MASFNRDRFRATPLSTVSSTVTETKQYDTFYGGSSDYAPFFKNVDGVTIKRVLPAHEPGDSPYVPMMTSMLECEVEDKKDGVVIGKKIAKKKIFIATLHAGSKYDIIDEYIKRVYALAEQYQDKDERNRFLNPITGYRMGKQWVSGIRPQLEYVYYALINGQIYRDSLKPKQMEALNKESAEMCAQDDTAAIDIFSDPSTGYPIQWSREKDENGKTVEVLKALPLPRTMSWDQYFEKYAVPDKVLEDLLKLPSLKSLYVGSYRKKDFEYALDGLKRFDQNNGYNIFADEDYLDYIERAEAELSKKWGSEEEASSAPQPRTAAPAPQEESPAKPKPATKKPTAKKAAPEEAKEPTLEQKLKVINEEFVRQYGNEYEEITVDDLGDDLDSTYLLAVKKEDLGYDLEHVPGWDAKPEAPAKPKPKATPKVEESEPKAAPEPQPQAAAPQPSGNATAQSALERIKAMRERAKLNKQ